MRVAVLIAVGAVALSALLYGHRARPLLDPDGGQSPQFVSNLPTVSQAPASSGFVPFGNAPDPTNLVLSSTRKRSFTPKEREELEKKFAAKLKPAIERWCRSYAGHVPFNPEELTMESFKEELFPNTHFRIYTFVLNGTTVSVEDSERRTVLNYVASGPQMHTLNQLPNDGRMPSLNMPVTREQIIELVKADTGVELQPSDIEMTPTGAGTALDGGAFVQIGHLFNDPNNSNCKLSFVFGPDGNIINYLRDFTF
jgi:hypothetical protein